eukprot:scaffold143380_cov45-Prasinocladus_malaysianus.AAC.3
MGRAHGLRCRTRDSHSRGFRKKGVIPLTTYLRTFKVGDYVDIKVNSAVMKGMPHKVYHGRTGVIWNVTKRAVGVEVNKEVKSNDAAKHDAKEKGVPAPKCKRQPVGPREGYTLENVKTETITAIPYDIIKEGLLDWENNRGGSASDFAAGGIH